MATYRVRSAGKRWVVEAVRFVGNFDEIERFVGGDAGFRDGQLVVATPQGALRASHGDWIVKDRGVFSRFSPDTFAADFTPEPP